MTTSDAVSIHVFRQPEEKVRPGDIVSLAPIYRALKVIRHLGNEQKA